MEWTDGRTGMDEWTGSSTKMDQTNRADQSTVHKQKDLRALNTTPNKLAQQVDGLTKILHVTTGAK